MSYSVNNQVANRVLRAKDSRHTQQVRKPVLIECGRAIRRCTVDSPLAKKQMKSSRRQGR